LTFDAPRRLRIPPLTALAASAACLVASCSGPLSIFGLDARPGVQGSAVHEVHQALFGHGSEAGHPIAAPATAEPSPQPSDGASATTRSAEVIGVGFKRPELAEIRRQLARLLRTGAIGEISDGDMTESSAAAGIFVQIGSHQLRTAADAQLDAARLTLASVISGFDVRVRSAMLPSQGRFFRVQIGPVASQGAALDLCRSLQKQRQSCFRVAEKSASPGKPAGHAALEGEWASIGPSETPAGQGRDELAETRPPSVTTSQVADAVPVYTTPTLPGLPE
jgi:hypothetical protein